MQRSSGRHSPQAYAAAASLLSALLLALHFYCNGQYGYFRDELGYIACGNHPAIGYVDQPPLVPLLVHWSQALFGDSLRAIRIVPAFAAAATLVLTAAFTRELGGRPFAVLLSTLSFFFAPIYLSDGSLMLTNCLEPLLWTVSSYAVVLVLRRGDHRYWLLFGVAAGLGMENKYSIAFFVVALIAGLVLTPERRILFNRWFLLSWAVGALLFLPNFVWNVQNHWPFLELIRNIKAEGRDVELSASSYFLQQVLLLSPVTAVLWLAGFAAPFFSTRLRPYRVLSYSYALTLTIFVLSKGKNYYLAPVYPMLLASGAVFLDEHLRDSLRWLKTTYAIVIVVSGLWLTPVVLPLLSPDQFLAYTHTLPFKIPNSEKSHAAAPLPQYYADQFGWPELTATVARAWYQIPAADRSACAIFGQNYGQAGAIDFFGPLYGLPPAVSGDRTYWLWGPRGYSGACMLVIGDRKETLDQLFDNVQLLAVSDTRYAEERNITVHLCTKPKFGSLKQLWPKLKHWY